jgi:lantibiotic biosynthesis protein
MSGQVWIPVLQGDSALLPAAEAVEVIARTLCASKLLPRIELEASLPRSLAYGDAGIAVFLTYYWRVSRSEWAAAGARRYLQQAVRALSTDRMPPDLYHGFAGISWAFEHLAHTLWAARSASDKSSEIHEALNIWVTKPWVPAELFQGLAGVALYCCECLPSKSGQNLLHTVVERLKALAEQKDAGGYTWPVSRFIRDDILKSGYAIDNVNRGLKGMLYRTDVSHGLFGVAACLAAVYAAGVSVDLARELVSGTLGWLLKAKRENAVHESFPLVIGADVPHITTGWCNGDLGIAIALLTIGNSFGCNGWIETAIRIARKEAAKRVTDIERDNQENYSLCHGSAGRAHIFMRLYMNTSDSNFLTAAKYWLSHLLSLQDMRHSRTAGFLLNEPRAGGLKETFGLMAGIAGIGLTLLAAIAPVEPAWDTLLLASMRKVPARES